MVSPTVGRCSHINLIKIPYKYVQHSISQVIIELIKLTTEINYHIVMVAHDPLPHPRSAEKVGDRWISEAC